MIFLLLKLEAFGWVYKLEGRMEIRVKDSGPFENNIPTYHCTYNHKKCWFMEGVAEIGITGAV